MPGVDVTLATNHLHMPRTCAMCGELASTRTLLLGRFRQPSRVSVPTCGSCWLRDGRLWPNLVMIAAAAVIAPIVSFSASGTLELPVKLLLTLSLAESALLTWLLFLVLGRYRSRGAVQLVKESPDQIVLFCRNESWGRELANRSDGKVEASHSRLPVGLLLATAGAAASLAFPAAYFGWLEAHGLVKLDNPTTEALTIWVDGKRTVDVPPNPDGKPPPELWLRVGRHRLAHGAGGMLDETTGTDVNVARSQHLYTPGATACYWQVQSFYSNDITQRRPPMESVLPRVAFQELRGADDWFVESPPTIEQSEGSKATSRVAILRDNACTALVRHGCGDAIVDGFIECENRARDEAALDACLPPALASCGLRPREGAAP